MSARRRRPIRRWLEGVVVAAALANATSVIAASEGAREAVQRAEMLLREAEQAEVQGNTDAMERSADAACALYLEHLGRRADETLECERSRIFLWFISGQVKRALEAGQALGDARRLSLGEANRHTLRVESDVALYLRGDGDLEAALALNRRVLEARRRVLGERDPHTLDSYANLAQVLEELGFASEALPLNRKAYDVSREVLGATHNETLISGINLGINLSALGRAEEALSHIDAVYVAARETLGDDHETTIAALQSLTVSMDELGRVEDALPLKEALVERSRRVRGEEHRRTISLMGNLAWSYAALRRFPLAIDTARQAVDLATRTLGPTHLQTYVHRGREAQVLLDAGERQAALDRLLPLDRDVAERLGTHHPLYQEIALRRWEVVHAAKPGPESLAELRGLVGERSGHPIAIHGRRILADAQLAIGDDAGAVQTLRELRDEVEAQRERRTVPRNEQATAQARPARSYKKLALVEQRLGQTFNAFASAEMAKGRTLLDSLATRRADRSGVLSAEETDRLAEYEVRAASLDTDVARATSPEQRAMVEARRFEVAREAAAFRSALRERHPKYAQLSRVAPVDLSARRTLPRDAVYVSYLVADDRMLAWTIGRTGPLLAHDLGEAATILANIDAWRLRLSGPANVPMWRLPDGSHRFGLSAPEPGAQRVPDAAVLERSLSDRLLAPLAARLRRTRVWVVSPDDALAALPLEALPLGARRVVESHEVRYVQTLAIHKLLDERHGAHAKLGDRRTMLAVGDARYGNGPASGVRGAPTGAGGEGGRALDALHIAWPPLPASGREVDAVAALFPGAETWKGERASERRLHDANRGGGLAGFRFLHFATHGYLSPATPLLSAIVLDQVDRDGEHDGYVTVTELLAYTLASDLTVLSACDTGLGPLVQGEGIIGLPYALFVAGNADAVVSLWPVYDATTADFMQRFFARVARGEGHARALAGVKREFAAQPRTRSPLHWAGFVLYGTK